ncbi:macro domain-containing protein [Thermodesulfovibrio hydrogeniphilus]
MIKILKGNLFKSKCQTLVNPVNTVGTMGKGLTLEFKKRFPDMFKDYRKRCAECKIKLGEPYLYTKSGVSPP